MSDTEVRTAEREAAQGDAYAAASVLRARVRAGELCEARVELAAFLGHAVARELIGVEHVPLVTPAFVSYIPCDSMILGDWLKSLQRKARQWVTGERECTACEGTGSHEVVADDRNACTCTHPNGRPPCGACENYPEGGYEMEISRCFSCSGTGSKVTETAEEQVMLRAAIAAGRVALEVLEATQYHSMPCDRRRAHDSGAACICGSPPRRAIDAAQAYADDPTEENREAWLDRHWDALPAWVPGPLWAPPHEMDYHVKYAAQEASEQAVRAAISEALIGWVLA